MKKIALFVPVYNEEEKLAEVLEQVPSSILGHAVDLVIVDDCSQDDSAAVASRFTSHVVRQETNRGVGEATKRGFQYIAQRRSSYEFVLKMDGDGQHNLHFLSQMVGALKAGNDIVICSRFHPLSDQTHTPIDRILLNMIFTEMLRKITGWELTDVRSGYMGFRISDVVKIANDIIVPRYGIPMEILLRIWAFKPDADIVELPHPALYGGNISRKLLDKYSSEVLQQKGSRLQMAYEALLLVVKSLDIPRAQILEMNGFAAHDDDPDLSLEQRSASI